MLRTILASTLISVAALSLGCGSQPQWEPAQKQELFKPTAMRLQPVFTQVRNFSGVEGKPDGIEALIEFQDQFGDPAKASGTVVFELFEYRPGFPDPRGNRVVNPFVASIDDVASQREHWSRTGRAYSFELAYPAVNPGKTYVLTATFEPVGGGRFFDRLVIEPAAPAKSSEQPASKPTNEPGVRNPAP